MATAQIKFNSASDKFELVHNGIRIMFSKHKQALYDFGLSKPKAIQFNITDIEDETEGHGEDLVVNHKMEVQKEKVHQKFDVNKRSMFMRQLTEMVVDGVMDSLIITGEAGTGKTHTVTEVLKDRGKREAYDFEVIKGYATAKAMYRQLYYAQDKLVIFDDCDSILSDKTAVNILKAALDSNEKRIVSWRTERIDEDLPDSFEFKGQIIFITNVPVEKIDGPIISRSFLVDVSMTLQEKVDRIKTILHDLDPKGMMLTNEEKEEAFEILAAYKDEASDLNIRSMLKTMVIRKGMAETHGEEAWKELAEYTMMQ